MSDFCKLINDINFDPGFFSGYDNTPDINENTNAYSYAVEKKFKDDYLKYIDIIYDKKIIHDNFENAIVSIIQNNSFGELIKAIYKPKIDNDIFVISLRFNSLVIAIEDLELFDFDICVGSRIYVENLKETVKERKIINGKKFIDISKLIFCQNNLSYGKFKLVIYPIKENYDYDISQIEVTIIGIELCHEMRNVYHIIKHHHLHV